MNNPSADPLQEIEMVASLGLDFIDLTLEPPAASSSQADIKAIFSALKRHGLGIVGHTAYYLPIGNPFPEIRQGAVTELKRCIGVFAALGTQWMNIHPDRHAPFHSRKFFVHQNLTSLEDLLPLARENNIGLMIENVPGEFNSAAQLADILDPMPEIGLHLDIGHCNLMVTSNTTFEILDRFGDRLRHVHIHDNKGGQADLHMPLGTGTVDVEGSIKALKQVGFDGTITLEVFTPDKNHVLYSRDLLRKLWG